MMDEQTNSASDATHDTEDDSGFGIDSILRIAINCLKLAAGDDGNTLDHLKNAKLCLDANICDHDPRVVEAVHKYRKDMHDIISRFFPEIDRYIGQANQALDEIDSAEAVTPEISQQHWFRASTSYDLAKQLLNRLGKFSYKDNRWAGKVRAELAKLKIRLDCVRDQT